jgi:hypothetical protein
MRAEARGGQIALGVAGKEDSLRVTQDRILDGPVEELLEVLEAILLVEPGIERSMRKDAVRFARGLRRPANLDAGPGPDAVHYQSVEAGSILAEPTPQRARQSEAAEGRWPQRMNGKADGGKVSGARLIQADNLHVNADGRGGARDLADDFGRAAVGRIQAANDMKDTQGGSVSWRDWAERPSI